MRPTRAEFLRHALALTGTPYIWGGRSDAGVDCFGYVAVTLFTVTSGKVDLRAGWWTDRAWGELEPTVVPKPGDLAFYGGTRPDDVDHVMVVLLPEGTLGMPKGLVLGACGGDSGTTTQTEATRRGACVQARTAVKYRSAFRGYRSLSRYLLEE